MIRDVYRRQGMTKASRDPKTIAQAYTADSIWRNRSTFLEGTAAIEQFLTEKWEKEKSYRLRKELFAFTDARIAVQFWCVRVAPHRLHTANRTRYEYQDSHDGMKWKRCYGLEDWTFAEDGKMRKRQMSGNDIEISGAGESSHEHVPSNLVVRVGGVFD
jgi:nuclear transport factor 2 (NTF2) superfamily protein